MRSTSIIVLCVYASVIVGCAPASARNRENRTLPVVRACLRSTHHSAPAVPRNTTLLDTLRPRPVALLAVRGELALIALYRTGSDAAKIFGSVRNTFPVLQHANVLIISLITPQPTKAMRNRVARCAFGPGARPSISPLVGKS